MDIEKVKEFTFEKKKYEIFVFRHESRIEVRVFSEGRPANGYVYSVDLPIRLGVKNKFGFDIVGDYIKTAESDIRKKRWEKYCKAVKILHDNKETWMVEQPAKSIVDRAVKWAEKIKPRETPRKKLCVR